METRPEAPLTTTEPTEFRDPAEAFWKTLVRCNPFYLFSAVLLLYGVYRASVDPAFLKDETSQVIFGEGPFRRIQHIAEITFIPGTKVIVFRVGQYLDLLCRHIALGQHKYFSAGFFINGQVHNNNRMPW